MKGKYFQIILKKVVKALVAITLLLSVSAFSTEKNSSKVRIGVLAKRGSERCMAKWGATADYLTKEIPEYTFSIVPLGFDEVVPAVKNEEIDFIFVNPAFYIALEHNYGARRIATLVNSCLGKGYTNYASVIFTHKDKRGIKELLDLKGNSFMAVDKNSFGGWYMTWREFKNSGINPHKDLAYLYFSGTHDAVIYAVRDGKVDAGCIRSDVLERMVAEGKIDLNDFKVLGTHCKSNELPFVHSTMHYPEWPFAKVKSTSDELSKKVAVALFKMPPDSHAAEVAKCKGWTIPCNYKSVRECLKTIQVHPFENYGKVTLGQAVRQHWISVLAVMVLLFMSFLFGVYAIQKKKQIANSAKAVLLNEIKFRALFESSDNAIIVLAANSCIDCNNAALKMFGCASKEEFQGKNPADFSPAVQPDGTDSQLSADKLLEVAIKTGSNRFEWVHQRINGEDFPTEVLLNTITLDKKVVIQAVVRDISERKKSEELQIANQTLKASSRYKSEFLTNMSHELRSPLNSILLLSNDLTRNKSGHLDGEELESAYIINKSGTDLLSLIDNILDLSKVEAGKMSVELSDVKFVDFSKNIKLNFSRIIKEKNLSLEICIDKNLPESLKTDAKKLNQIITNLISNAIKFTQKGSINISINLPRKDANLAKSALRIEQAIAFSVSDNGIGIPEEQQQAIFEAFQQVDGSISREFGGTGLGLSISRTLSKLLGGEIQLESTPEQGSIFTLYLPIVGKSVSGDQLPVSRELENQISKRQIQEALPPVRENAITTIKDDRNQINPADNIILIVEDDPVFSKILMRQCQKNGFKCLRASDGEEGMQLAVDRKPSAIILDIRLPGKEGWAVLNELKENLETRHIPVYIMSGIDNLNKSSKWGVLGVLKKPIRKKELDETFKKISDFIHRKKKNLLIAGNDEYGKNIKKLLGNGDIKTIDTASGKEAVKLLKSETIDCMIMGLKLLDMSSFELLDMLDSINNINMPPVVIYTGKNLSKTELIKLGEYSETITIKGVQSEEHFLDETAFALHRIIENLPEDMRKIIKDLHDTENLFQDQKIMVVDDDMRNVFALSKILIGMGIKVIKAENGKKALSLLQENSDTDLILMDIMMPEMDGYEAMRQIRDPKTEIKNHDIPIIAFTAKAMITDRKQCIEAGASDYLSKPVSTEKLLSMLRIWLYNR